jgi:hypothetical protein
LIIAGVAAAVLVAAVVAAISLWPKGQNATTTPAVCALAQPASGFATPTPGSPRPTLPYVPPTDWTRKDYSSGYRMALPSRFVQLGSGDCFGIPAEGRYVVVAQWQQPDKDMRAYWTNNQAALGARLSKYHLDKIEVVPYLDAAAEWNFTFEDNGTSMRAVGRAFATGNRRYAFFWITKADVWSDYLPAFTTFQGGFQPAA